MNGKVININENNISFQAKQYFGQPRLWDAFMKLKTAKSDSFKLLIMMKRIAESLKKEGDFIELAIEDVKKPYFISRAEGDPPSFPEFGSPEFIELNSKISNLLETYISIVYPKIKMSQITGIDSVGELYALEGIIDIDIDIDEKPL